MSLQQGNIVHSSLYFPEKEKRELEIHPLPSCCQYNFLTEMSFEVQQQNNFMIPILAVLKLDLKETSVITTHSQKVECDQVFTECGRQWRK